MIRRLFPILAAISLLLLLLSIALSADGCWRTDGVDADWRYPTVQVDGYKTAEDYASVYSSRGGVELFYFYKGPRRASGLTGTHTWYPPGRQSLSRHLIHVPKPSSEEWEAVTRFLGIHWGMADFRPGALKAVLFLPVWLLILTTAPLPLLWLHLLRRPARDPFACGSCGYDMRASPGRCPECGEKAGA